MTFSSPAPISLGDRRVRALSCGAVYALAIIVGAGAAAAQELRADVIAAEQAEKARHLDPDTPTDAERIVEKVRDTFFQQRRGLYPYLDSVYGGGGFTLGAGFLQYFGDRSTLDFRGLYSLKNYKLFEVVTLSPGHLDGRLELQTEVGWRDATRVGYYGLGIDTDKPDRADYRFQETYARAIARLRPSRWTAIAGGVGFEDYVLLGAEGERPSIETVYTPDEAPGLGASPRFVHSEITGAIDWRTSPGYTRSGGYYGVTLHNYADPDDAYGFSRLDANVIQHIPVLKETWVLSLRGRMQSTLGDDSLVPYFLLPSLGGGSVLRGYSTGRFRDRHALITTAEWRWFPNRTAFDVAFFFDAGTVSARRGDLWSERMKTDYGIGARFHGPRVTPLRVELAGGSDGWKMVFAGTPAF